MSTLYVVDRKGILGLADEQVVIEAALALLKPKLAGASLTSASLVRDFLKLQHANLPYEVFSVIFLDVHHRVIEFKQLFRGTLSGCNVYVEQVAREALLLSASAVVLVHNHPSGVAEPSQPDRALTADVSKALSLFRVKTLDHFIIANDEIYSFMEHGLL